MARLDNLSLENQLELMELTTKPKSDILPTSDEVLGFPDTIGFMTLAGIKELKCTLCGKKANCGKYEGHGLKWSLCQPHALVTERWALSNLGALTDHAKEAERLERLAKLERAADKIEKGLREGWNAE